ncbi:MAG: hypothetical protein ACREIA_16030 [Opitutaceae bacterium]
MFALRRIPERCRELFTFEPAWSAFGALAPATIALLAGTAARLVIGASASNTDVCTAMRKLD